LQAGDDDEEGAQTRDSQLPRVAMLKVKGLKSQRAMAVLLQLRRLNQLR